ncbi:MAG TPA: HD domain-containing protein [Anaerolineae bacterium]|nr:HD domain-containing protein [Anaerolineae bacterium]HQH40002.1 HD domain-containing protein [Anaerolineae bacterium]
MSKPDWEGAKTYILARLERGLSPDLRYHNIHHTRDDVLPAVERLAALANVPEADSLLLRTAALYHDTGYLEQYTNHESVGVRIAQETLPDFGYSPDQIAVVTRMILATGMPQTPKTFLEALLCDADLDSLGREDYLLTSHNLYAELETRGASITPEAWYRRQLDFLSAHTYFTDVAQNLRNNGKQENILLLHKLLATLGSPPDKVQKK